MSQQSRPRPLLHKVLDDIEELKLRVTKLESKK